MEQFTVVIPTRDRCGTLAHTLETCIAQQDDNFCVLISDNHSTDGTRDLVEAFRQRDSRVKLVSPPRSMGFAAHHDFAIGQADPGYVMLLGSDDGLLPGAVPRARKYLSEYPGISAMHNYPCPNYHYPDYGGDRAGKLYVDITPVCEIRDSKQWLEKAGRFRCDITQLPFLYQQAWVRTDIIDKIQSRFGRRMLSMIPDISLAIAIAATTETYLRVNPGFGIAGNSPASSGRSIATAEGDRAREKEFLGNSEIGVHAKFPYSRSLYTLIGDSFLRVKEAGLLPENFEIAWNEMIARALLEVHSGNWGDEERKQNLEDLRQVALNFCCDEVLDAFSNYRSADEWVRQFSFWYEYEYGQWDTEIDATRLGVTDVNQAARLAETVLLAANRASAEEVGGVECPNDTQILAHCLLQASRRIDHLSGDLVCIQGELTRRIAESARRARERDEARAKAAQLRNKMEETSRRS